MNTKKIGDLSEIKFIGKCLEYGWDIFVPIGNSGKKDCILDRGKGLERVQIKTGRLKDGIIYFDTSSSHFMFAKKKYCKQDYQEEIDIFGIYCPKIDKCYLIEIDGLPLRNGVLRIKATKNNQVKNIRWAKDYVI